MEYPKIDIIEFIDNFRTKFGEYSPGPFKTDSKANAVRSLFKDGFCYYFANILEQAYPGGELCIPWPIGHFIYLYNGKYYDIEGEYILKEYDCECAIPLKLPYFINEDYLKWIKLDFMHTLNYDYIDGNLCSIFNYCKLNGIDYTKHYIALTKTEAHIVVFLIYSFRYGYDESVANECYEASIHYYKFMDNKDRFKELVEFAKLIHENKIKC